MNYIYSKTISCFIMAANILTLWILRILWIRQPIATLSTTWLCFFLCVSTVLCVDKLVVVSDLVGVFPALFPLYIPLFIQQWRMNDWMSWICNRLKSVVHYEMPQRCFLKKASNFTAHWDVHHRVTTTTRSHLSSHRDSHSPFSSKIITNRHKPSQTSWIWNIVKKWDKKWFWFDEIIFSAIWLVNDFFAS